MRVKLENGEYTVVMEDGGRLHALRWGEEWRDLVGDQLVLCLAQEVERLRRLASDQAEELADIKREFGPYGG